MKETTMGAAQRGAKKTFNVKTIAVVLVSVLALGAVAAGCSSSSSSDGGSAGSIKVTNVLARSSATAQGNGAVYFTIANSATLPDLLVSASVSDTIAKTTEIHETKQAGGMMSMSPVKSVLIPANGTVEFAPGGNHVMLMDLVSPLEVGKTFDMKLGFLNAGVVTVKAKVVAE